MPAFSRDLYCYIHVSLALTPLFSHKCTFSAIPGKAKVAPYKLLTSLPPSSIMNSRLFFPYLSNKNAEMLDAPCGPLQFRARTLIVVPNLLIKAKPCQNGPFRLKVVLEKELKCIKNTQQIILAIGGACCQLT
jgi:hypothetical protein